MMTYLSVAPHPLLDLAAFTAHFPQTVAGQAASVRALLSPNAEAPLRSDDTVRTAVRDLLRHGGYKPTGRGKPASEYLLRAVTEGSLGNINLVVDACNACSYHSGLPISVIDTERSRAPWRVGLATEGTEYIFNHSGQSIDVSGLLCLFDSDGACANPVKDSQRTKTHAETREVMVVVWGTHALPGRAAAVGHWYREMLSRLGATTTLDPQA
jgi:DNA/RNA-binding domain of Phe-tRNA-synthetase-like protein